MSKELRISICRQRLSRLVRVKIMGMVFILLLLGRLTADYSGTTEIVAIRVEGNPGERIVTLEFTEAVNYRSFTLGNPPRVVLDVPGVAFTELKTIEVRNEVIETINYRQHQPGTIRLVVNLAQPAESRVRKVGRELQLHLSLPREMRARLRAEERARQLLTQGIKRETELKAGEVVAEKERALRVVREEARARERELQAYLSRGERHFRAQRFDDALEEFEAVLALDSGNERARHYLILTRERKEAQLLAQEVLAREEKARREDEQREREIRRREEEREERIAGHLNRGREYYLQGRYTEAIFQGERVLAFIPDHRRAEDLIMQARRGTLERDKRRAREEREIVEARRILDVTRAPFISPVDYFSALAPEREREVLDPVLKEDLEELVPALREKVEEIMIAVDFRALDIREVLLQLAKMSQVMIAVDERAIDMLLDPRVTIFTPVPIPLTDVLGIILRVKGLGYAIREHYIWVTEAGLEEETVIRVFPLRYGIRRVRPVVPDDEDRRDRGRDQRGAHR